MVACHFVPGPGGTSGSIALTRGFENETDLVAPFSSRQDGLVFRSAEFTKNINLHIIGVALGWEITGLRRTIHDAHPVPR